MAFAPLIKGLVNNAFSILGDLAEDVTFKSLGSVTYNTTTGATTRAETNTTVKAVLARFRIDELDSQVVVMTDMKLLIPAEQLPTPPKINDIVTAKSKEWTVVRILGVPGESLHIVHIREV